MSKKIIDMPEINDEAEGWAALLEEIRKQEAADPDLTDEEKRFLDELENLPEDEWEPITCPGKPVSEIIIEDRGER
ncbi:MAG: hypothetical protein AB1631_19610 [Acidobacteriota bacterium]